MKPPGGRESDSDSDYLGPLRPPAGGHQGRFLLGGNQRLFVTGASPAWTKLPHRSVIDLEASSGKARATRPRTVKILLTPLHQAIRGAGPAIFFGL